MFIKVKKYPKHGEFDISDYENKKIVELSEEFISKYRQLPSLTCDQCINQKEVFCRLAPNTIIRIDELPDKCPLTMNVR